MEVKASHFSLGFDKGHPNQIDQSKQDEALKLKWQPEQAKKSGSMARSNFTIGQNKVFNGQTSAKSDYKPNTEGVSSEAVENRKAMIQELRKSHLPSGDANIPQTTAQDHFKTSLDPAQEAIAAKQRKEEQKHIVNKVRGFKPNFKFGAD